jgi:hypothetical protein
MKRISALASSGVLLLLISFGGPAVSAQTIGERFSEAQPELAGLFDAAYISQARMFEGIAAIGASPAARDARNQFESSLRMQASMSMAEMMAMINMRTGVNMSGPFDSWESEVRSKMTALLRTKPSSTEILGAYEGSPLPERAVEVIRIGRLFEDRVYEILADTAVMDKGTALEDVVKMYLSSGLSVPDRPKPANLLFDHPHAGAFLSGYPKLCGLLWSTQWLQLAAIEAMILPEQADDRGSVAAVGERFQNKIVPDALTRSPVPVELPMAPAIAPGLFSLSQQTAIILDNLNMFETVVADILGYPNVENRAAIVDSLVDEFTNHAENFDPTIDYLASALRGGIYNQGGPALGELSQSERNQSRMEMGMGHSMIMATP